MSDDFADFSAPPSPATTTPIPAITSIRPTGTTVNPASFATPAPINPNSPWYAVWERHSPSEFAFEAYVLLFIFVVVGVHQWGLRRNRKIAKDWLDTHREVLEKEFALVGFDYEKRANTLDTGANDDELLAGHGRKEEVQMRENGPTEFVLYASGRKHIAFTHITLRLLRRNNPLQLISEYLASFILDAYPTPYDTVTVILQPFDGQESQFGVPLTKDGGTSKYDNFVWAIVNKQNMSRYREERYDLSLTTTKDWESLPNWCTVMHETKEIGEAVLTKEVREAVEKMGQGGGLEYLIVTDQRLEKPTKLEETVPKKRLSLHLTLPFSTGTAEHKSASAALLQAFIRLPDHLVSVAHFRPEVQKKLKATREEQAKALSKVAEEEDKEARELKRAEEKRRERDEKLRGMSAEAQKKFIEKEKEREMRRIGKKMGKKA